MLPPAVVLDPLIDDWLREDIGRGDQTTSALDGIRERSGKAVWVARETGVIAGLSIAQRVFHLLDSHAEFEALMQDGDLCQRGLPIAQIHGTLETLLMGERVALNLVMRLSGVASLTRQYVDQIADLSAQLVDTRKTTPGLRLLEKYAVRVGGARNHRLGLDDGVMIKDNHIAAAGSITAAIAQIRRNIPYPLTIEVETESLAQVEEALMAGADIIMLDNMAIETMEGAVELIRRRAPQIKIEASGNITLDTIRAVAKTGVDFISSSAPITRSTWLDVSMRLE